MLELATRTNLMLSFPPFRRVNSFSLHSLYVFGFSRFCPRLESLIDVKFRHGSALCIRNYILYAVVCKGVAGCKHPCCSAWEESRQKKERKAEKASDHLDVGFRGWAIMSWHVVPDVASALNVARASRRMDVAEDAEAALDPRIQVSSRERFHFVDDSLGSV